MIRHDSTSRLCAAVAFSALLLVAACTTTTIVDPYYRPASAQVDHAYISPTADFRSYTKLMGRPLEIYYPDNVPQPDARDIERLRSIFREAFLGAIGQDYEIVSEPGPGVMLVAAQIIDLKLLGPGGTYEPSGRLREVVAKGQLTLLMEFQDSQTGRVLARAGEAERGASTSGSDDAAGWAQVEAAAARWAELFKRFLDNNLG
jgi:hypothetical protein